MLREYAQHDSLPWPAPTFSEQSFPLSMQMKSIGFIHDHAAYAAIACVLLYSSCLFVTGCASRNASADKRAEDVVNQQGPWTFLGLGDNQDRKIEQDNPQIDPRFRGITTVTKVQLADSQAYEAAKRGGSVSGEVTHDGMLYYAIVRTLHAPPAYFLVTERYKVPLPAGHR